MAILKHISVKNRFYSSAVEYLTCQFDEYTNKPVLDEKGRIQERENYLIVGVNCDVDSFGAECIEVNRLYGKNNSVKDVINEEFENDKTGEKVQGITIIVDGKLKEVLDLLMKNNPDYKNYTEIVRDAFFDGINSMIREHK